MEEVGISLAYYPSKAKAKLNGSYVWESAVPRASLGAPPSRRFSLLKRLLGNLK